MEDQIATVATTRPAAAGDDASPRWTRSSRIAATIAGAVWVSVLVAILRQPVFLTTDMVSNNAHVWYIADRLWHGGGLPWHMSSLASGRAYAFPYAAIPWLVGAVLWPLGGDRVVTALLVVAAIALVIATFWAFPRLRHGWWAVAVLLNPALVASVLLGQLPFLWAAAAFMVSIGAWRRQRFVTATIMAALSSITHPAVMLPISAIAVIAALPRESHRGRLLFCWAISVVAAVPALLLAITSPVVAQTTHWQQLGSLITTVLARAVVFAVPVALDVAATHLWRVTAFPTGVTALFIVLIVLMWRPFLLDVGWSGLTRRTMPTELATFVDRPPLQRGRIYRVLPGADQKYGLYRVIRNGGVLDSELFPESLHRGGFADEVAYARFLRDRDVQSIVVTPGYATHFHSNEPAMLAALADSGRCVDGIRIGSGPVGATWQQYDVSKC